MFSEELNKNYEVLIAKAADFTNKPFIHSVVKVSGESHIDEGELDFTVNILCRDIDGNRLEIYDLELEIYETNKELVLVIAKLNFTEAPILWSGNKNVWMDSKSGKMCNPPKYNSRLENLASRIRNVFD